MSRKRRTTPFEDLVEIASLLPYWVSLIIAVITYLLFHSYATADAQPVIQPGSPIPQNMGGMMFKTFATFLQYIVPGAFVFGAILSGMKSLQARTQARRYEQWSTPTSPVQSSRLAQKRSKPTDDMDWAQFELLVGEAFRRKGYRVIHGGDVGADGGVDVHLRKEGKQYFVQCKHWKTKRVGVAVIRELYGVMVSSGVAGGYVVTSGEFTEEAQSFAEGKPIKLVNGDGLARMLGRKPLVSSGASAASVSADTVIHCPKCRAPMVKRTAKRGTKAGQAFWGCSRFPKCRATIA